MVCISSPTGRRIGAICCCLNRSRETLSRRSGNRLVGLLLLILLRQAVHHLCLASFGGQARGRGAVRRVLADIAPTESDRRSGDRFESSSRRGFDRGAFHSRRGHYSTTEGIRKFVTALLTIIEFSFLFFFIVALPGLCPEPDERTIAS